MPGLGTGDMDLTLGKTTNSEKQWTTSAQTVGENIGSNDYNVQFDVKVKYRLWTLRSDVVAELLVGNSMYLQIPVVLIGLTWDMDGIFNDGCLGVA